MSDVTQLWLSVIFVSLGIGTIFLTVNTERT